MCTPRLSAARGHPAKAGARVVGGMRGLLLHAPTKKEVVYGKVVVTFKTDGQNRPGFILPSLRMDLAVWGYEGYVFLDPSRPDFGSCQCRTWVNVRCLSLLTDRFGCALSAPATLDRSPADSGSLTGSCGGEVQVSRTAAHGRAEMRAPVGPGAGLANTGRGGAAGRDRWGDVTRASGEETCRMVGRICYGVGAARGRGR